MAGCCVLVELDDFSTLDDWKDILEYADNNKNIVGYNNAFTSDIICEAANFENVPYTEKQSDFEKNKDNNSSSPVKNPNVAHNLFLPLSITDRLDHHRNYYCSGILQIRQDQLGGEDCV